MNAQVTATNVFRQEKPPPQLFHYTSAEGLIGIISGKTLRAGSIEYLNDAAEFRHGKEVMRTIVATRMRDAIGDHREFFNKLASSDSVLQAEDFFVISLSEADDLLSQWRGYTPSNCGFCIGFDTQVLTKAAEELAHMQLVQCVYDAGEQTALAEAELNLWLAAWVDQQEAGRREKKDLANMAYITLHNVHESFIAAAMKNSTFAEESEWRLLGLCRKPERFRFRPGKSSLIPYIELTWGKDTKAPDAQPIHSVTVGPCPDPKLAIKAVSRLLASHGLESVKVKESQIPFRSW